MGLLDIPPKAPGQNAAGEPISPRTDADGGLQNRPAPQVLVLHSGDADGMGIINATIDPAVYRGRRLMRIVYHTNGTLVDAEVKIRLRMGDFEAGDIGFEQISQFAEYVIPTGSSFVTIGPWPDIRAGAQKAGHVYYQQPAFDVFPKLSIQVVELGDANQGTIHVEVVMD